MHRLGDLEAFLAIVERGSQTAAARQLRRSLQSINRSLLALERSIGVELVRRTTRKSSPTEAGRSFYNRVHPAFQEIAAARLDAANRRAEPSGSMRLGAPVLFAPAYVVPAISDFMRSYPRVEIELKTSDRNVDLLEEGLDLAVRIRHLPDSRLRAQRLGELRVVTYAAPAYLAEHGRPKQPADLRQHNCVLRTSDGELEIWPFRVAGRQRSIRVRGRLRTDGTSAAHVAVARGLGIGRTPLWQIRNLVDRGAVELVLENFEPAKLPVYAVWPASKIAAERTRLFVALLASRLKREPLL
ncbi:MAG TPA: LysR family transcriptional regulator [Hyphomicrobiaceae bacterium]|nr:LysR family transcriptional regulator [Hyphomicrobiaceae bacterium]